MHVWVHALSDIIGGLCFLCFDWCALCRHSELLPTVVEITGTGWRLLFCFRSFKARFCFGCTILSMEVCTCEHILIDRALVFWLALKHPVQ